MPSATNLQDQNELLIDGQSPENPFLHDFLGFEDAKLRGIRPRGSVIFSEGQPAKGVYVLCSGRAKVSISSSEAKTVILRIAQPGDLLGVNAIVKRLPYEASVETLERCQLDFIPGSDFLRILDRSKAAQVAVTRALANELSEIVEHARSLLLSKSAAEKLARLLLRWCDLFGEPTAKGIRLNHGLTQEEIAQMICSSRETVSRLLAELKRKQIVHANGTGIFVRNRPMLELAARV